MPVRQFIGCSEWPLDKSLKTNIGHAINLPQTISKCNSRDTFIPIVETHLYQHNLSTRRTFWACKKMQLLLSGLAVRCRSSDSSRAGRWHWASLSSRAPHGSGRRAAGHRQLVETNACSLYSWLSPCEAPAVRKHKLYSWFGFAYQICAAYYSQIPLINPHEIIMKRTLTLIDLDEMKFLTFLTFSFVAHTILKTNQPVSPLH